MRDKELVFVIVIDTQASLRTRTDPLLPDINEEISGNLSSQTRLMRWPRIEPCNNAQAMF